MAKVKMFGKEALFYLIIFIFLVPGVLTLTPSFVLASQLGMRNSLPGLALWYMGGGQVFAIAVPLAQPILVTLGILNFLAIYNDLIWPMLMLPSPANHTLMLALQGYFPPNDKLPGRPEMGVIAAGYAFASLPILLVFIFGMKYYIEGLTSGAVKS